MIERRRYRIDSWEVLWGRSVGRESLGDDWEVDDWAARGYRNRGFQRYRYVSVHKELRYREAWYGSEVRLNEIARPDELGAQEGGRYYTNLTYRIEGTPLEYHT